VHSRVSQAKAREQDYQLLGYLNIRPRTSFLGKLRNPNPAMPDYSELPLSRQEYNKKNHPAGMEHGHEPVHGAPHGEGHSTPAHELHGEAKPTAFLGKNFFGGNS
jgi:molybdopterin-containing oxidoreductase family iron-sulfur binding subunit